MFKVLLVASFAAVALAQLHGGYQNGYQNGYGVGNIGSSQNIVLHQTHGQVQHAPVISHQPVLVHQPVHYAAPVAHQQEHYAPAHYSFEYNVHDPHTGDIKSQHESREGDAVQGYYSLHEADGTVRRVEYTADAHSGFNAVVHREGHATHAVPAPAYHH
ncbi:cuticle protein 7-like [Leptidea sinapis]|uniref:cuticle protein 7-like n=1 Tax=Leptidea sinapis TaxID=189913 RepID=UPI0021C2AA08|nr:cuticle protein 7-like [Leptidea sinapis]